MFYETLQYGIGGRLTANGDLPFQVELFSRQPDLLINEEKAYLTPIPVDDDL